MVRRQNRLLVTLYVLGDALMGVLAFALAYYIRFDSGLIPLIKGRPPFGNYLQIIPFIAILVPLAFQLHGVYRLRRGRSRVDDFFGVFVGTVLAVVLGIVGTLYIQAYYVSDVNKDRGVYEISQVVWALFLFLNVALTFGVRLAVRETLQRRWRAGIGLKRVLIAGAGDLGRQVADRILEHRELGYVIVGFVDDRAVGDHIGYRGLPLLGTLTDVSEIIQGERVDQVYVALPLEEHVKMLTIIDQTSREVVDVRVVPDLLQFIALRARLEDLDGIPMIAINDVPLQGFNSVLKRMLDIAISGPALAVLALPMLVIAMLVKVTSRGAVFYHQERMGLDGRAFTVYKFRSMHAGAEDMSGPVWAREDDPRATQLGRFLRRFDLDELPQFWNVLRGDMSIVGPRPERPYFVQLFKQRIPQYMLRHKVKAGITGWAQVNGWRGNTSLRKRVQYDLYYITHWNPWFDIRIMLLTIWRGIFHKNAY